MAYVILPSRRRRPDVFELDHSHDLAQGLVFAGLGQAPRTLKYIDGSRFKCSGFLQSMSVNNWVVNDRELKRNSIYFDGVNNNVVCSNIASASLFAVTTMTVVSWVKILGSLFPGNCMFFGTGYNTGWVMEHYNRQPGLWIQQNNFGLSNSDVQPLGTWQHWAFVVNGIASNSVFFYLNGKFITQYGPAHSGPGNRTSLCLGRNGQGSNFPFNGHIADPMAYNRALSADEIKALANRTDPMLAGLIRDKKLPNTKLWHGADLPDDYKVKTVAPVVLNRSLNNQPNGPVQIDWSNPLTRGLVHAYNLGDSLCTNLVNNNKPQISRYVAKVPGGRTFVYGSAKMDVKDTPLTRFTMFGVAKCPSNAVVGALWQRRDESTGTQNYSLLFEYGLARVGFLDQLSVWRYISGTTNIAEGTECVLAGVYNGAELKVFLNGKQENATACPNNPATSGTFTTNVGSGSGIDYLRYTGKCYRLALLFNRALSPVEIKRLSANPWQVLKPQKHTIYAFNSKFGVVGTQNANTLQWTWGE